MQLQIRIGNIKYMEKILTIIDISSEYYSTCYNCNKEDDNRRDDFSYYKETFDNYIENILIDTKATHYLAFGDGYTSFRKQLFSDFKGDRKKKSQYFKFMTDLKVYGTTKWIVITNNILESDDLCLIHANEIISFDKIIIASKDSDLRQFNGNFFDYGYKRKKLHISDAFEEITHDQAIHNLWKQVLIKGHNNKVDYLVACGVESAKGYLAAFSTNQKKLAVLNAFILGMDKEKYIISRNIKGYGLMKGIEKFQKAFTQSYLLRTVEEAQAFDETFTLNDPIEWTKPEVINDNNLIL